MEPEPWESQTPSEEPGVSVTVAVGITLAEMERLLIEATLRWTNGNRKRTASILGIDRTTLYNKMKRHAIEECRVTDLPPV